MDGTGSQDIFLFLRHVHLCFSDGYPRTEIACATTLWLLAAAAGCVGTRVAR